LLNILFVCTGNTCRSPLAEALLKHELKERSPRFEAAVTSAGLSVFKGELIAEKVAILLQQNMIEVDAERPAVPIDHDLVSEADLILTMTADQLKQIAFRFPGATSKAYRFKDYCGLKAGDIEDPIGKSLEKYRLVLKEIRLGVKNLMTKLEEG
jgi:protein arginine phosphatase